MGWEKQINKKERRENKRDIKVKRCDGRNREIRKIERRENTRESKVKRCEGEKERQGIKRKQKREQSKKM